MGSPRGRLDRSGRVTTGHGVRPRARVGARGTYAPDGRHGCVGLYRFMVRLTRGAGLASPLGHYLGFLGHDRALAVALIILYGRMTMTLNDLIEELQGLRGDDSGGGVGNGGNLLVYFDSGHGSVLRPVGKVHIALDVVDNRREVWLSVG